MRQSTLWAILFCTVSLAHVHAQEPQIKLRAYGVPTGFGMGPINAAEREIIDVFRVEHPSVDPVSTTGLQLPGVRTMDMVPLMQIAGDIPPHVLYVNFRQSQTYIDMKLLYPLDRYVETAIGVTLEDSGRMPLERYLDALRQGAGWHDLDARVPSQCWQVMRRSCPYGESCPYRKTWRQDPASRHEHIWAFPMGPLVMGLKYDRTVFAEHADEGVAMRAPRDWDEMLQWAKICHDPGNRVFGFQVMLGQPSWNYANFLYSAGGDVVVRDDAGDWRAVLDSEAAVEAAYFFTRLWCEPVVRDGRIISRGVVQTSQENHSTSRFAMSLAYLDSRFLQAAMDQQTQGFGPVPRGPTGLRRSEFNAQMLGIFSGLAEDEATRDAAWAYIEFLDGIEARRIRTERLVEAGMGPFVRRQLLERFNEGGRYDGIIRRIPDELTRAYEIAFAGGVPEPYGKNCSPIYDEMAKPLGAILTSPIVTAAVARGDPATGKAEIRNILKRANLQINQRLLGNLPVRARARRTTVAWIVIAAVAMVFLVMLRGVLRTFTPPHPREAPGIPRPSGLRGFGRRVFLRGGATAAASAGRSLRRAGDLRAWILMAPALLLIAMWMYWPVIRGSVIAFQDYSVLGDSAWVGADNFAAVLFNGEFWYSLKISLFYALMFMLFGFTAPILLALLLSEVPRGKVFFRCVYYLPAVLSGVVVIFLWRSFYTPDGLLNELINGLVRLGNWIYDAIWSQRPFELCNKDWLSDPGWALFLCLLPTIWAGMGPGCLIYLAALKTVSDDLYEAADIDGAGITRKVFAITLPSIHALVMINFIGAMIGAIRGAGGFVLAMTGGGPYGEFGGATEVIGLKLFYVTFGYLQFGVGAAMAWVLGSMLIGFTVLQLKRMSRLEFRTAKT